MELERIWVLCLFGILHWVLAVMLLNDLAHRKKVRWGRKVPWVLVIIFITYIGSLLYLLFNPHFFYDSDDEDE